ncbi:MAG: alpha/beta hydrolase-fold protein [Myxococcaceae bacterium]
MTKAGRCQGLALVAALTGAGCAAWLPAAVPMKKVAYPHASAPARCLLVLLPGRGDGAGTFEEHGFVGAVRARGLSVDLVAADATMGYYFKGILPERLRADVIEPAKARGYEKTWLLGISMGGMGALMSAERSPGIADGLVLFAPYLGDDALVREIEASGGLARWDPGPLDERFDEETYQRHVWAWLKAAAAAGRPPIYLAVGEGDERMARGVRVLAQALPPQQVSRAPGGHDWPPWTRLWSGLLESSQLARECAAR